MNLGLTVLFIFISSVFGAFSLLLFKIGSAFRINLKNKKMIWSVILAGFSLLFYLYALKQAPLIFIYLIGSISYVWTIILARTILKEKINRYKIVGMFLIFVGIIFLNVKFPF